MKLGFGLMRLPRKGPIIDIEQTKKMVDMFLEAGGTYFDTAFIYPGSEDATRKALVTRHPRESYTLATKLFAGYIPTEKMAKDELHTSLKRTGAEYIDYYLLHTLMESNYRKYDKFGLWDFVKEEKAKGTIRHYGFSFHDGPELLERILSAHPDVDFVQLQINYADWENPKVTSRANYEVARKYGIPIVVMEPVKGGTLANPPRDVKALLTDYAPDASPASWAIRFVASLDGILSVLSGMSNIAQMEDNLSYMRDFQPLSAQEMEVIHEAQRLLGHSKTIACTSCHYCTEGCPKQIPIPEIFSALNLELGSGQGDAARESYRKILEKGNGADACIACGQCERRCPQHLNIIESLKQAASTLQ